jgi:hypothetical protein
MYDDGATTFPAPQTSDAMVPYLKKKKDNHVEHPRPVKLWFLTLKKKRTTMWNCNENIRLLATEGKFHENKKLPDIKTI